MNESHSEPAYGLMAEFEEPEDLLSAARRTFSEGYRKIDAFSPLPIHGLAAAIGFPQTNIGVLTFIYGVIGGLTGYFLQYWVHVIDYPINIGGRPHHTGPMFIPVTFEMTILFAAVGTVISLLALNRLPQPYHPVFNAPGFERASQDRFFLCIEADDPQYDASGTRSFLQSLDPVNVAEVEP
ncbi:MAG: DUF3341 domain-containing protein [Candidatus Latescibacterota bacterium]|nr:DUF3341 domain-containing protein [Candidatus Latescibacterota bacterium]